MRPPPYFQYVLPIHSAIDMHEVGCGAMTCIMTHILAHALSEQIAHSTVDLHLKEISEFLHGSVMNKNLSLP